MIEFRPPAAKAVRDGPSTLALLDGYILSNLHLVAGANLANTLQFQTFYFPPTP